MGIMEDLKEARELLRNYPCAFVLSPRARNYIETHCKDMDETALGYSDCKTDEIGMFGTPLYTFYDVPDSECLAFYDRKVLNRYLKLREKIGHEAALMRLTAYVDDGLIMKAEIRALLEQN